MSRLFVVLLFAVVPATSAVLPIPDRPQHPSSPPSGWCGETASQEALLHYGVWAPQSTIHRAGNSKHPDLYSDEIPTALAALGVLSTKYVAMTKGFAAYEQWVREAIDRGEPVLAGVKILPTDHPEWGLDHFVLVSGYGPKGLLVNTTWDSQIWASDSTKKGISFANAFYAIRITGVTQPVKTKAARLTVLAEAKTTVRLRVTCIDGDPKARHRIERRSSLWDEAPLGFEDGSERVVDEDASRTARFACVRL
jgi:hypothetical protein